MFITLIEPDLGGYHIVVDYEEGDNKDIAVDFLRLSEREDVERVFMNEESVWVIIEGEAKWHVSSGMSGTFKRDNVFKDLPQGVYLPPEGIIRILSTSPITEIAVIRSRTDKSYSATFVSSENIKETKQEGYGCNHLVREIVGENFTAAKLLISETIVEYPNWGDFPPVKFEDSERISLFRIKNKGFGLLYSYTGEEFDEKEATVIQDYSVTVDNGYRSFTPTPNNAIYCLWGISTSNRKLKRSLEVGV